MTPWNIAALVAVGLTVLVNFYAVDKSGFGSKFSPTHIPMKSGDSIPLISPEEQREKDRLLVKHRRMFWYSAYACSFFLVFVLAPNWAGGVGCAILALFTFSAIAIFWTEYFKLPGKNGRTIGPLDFQ